MDVKLDPMAALTAAGLIASLLTGQLKGGGLQVGARIVPGSGVQIGVDPLIYGTAELPINGITLGTTALANNDFGPYLTSMVLGYEAGHIPGYNAFGIAYPAVSQDANMVWALDPGSPIVWANGYIPTMTRAINPTILPRQFHNLYLTFGEPPPQPSIEAAMAVVNSLAAPSSRFAKSVEELYLMPVSNGGR